MQAIFNQMYLDGWNMEQEAHGIVVRITRPDLSTTPADYGPITWLNTDYKIQARIRKNRLRPTLFDILRASHYIGVPGTTIFSAVTTVRNAIAYVGLTHAALCTLSLQFPAAFHEIFHTYLLRMIKIMAIVWNSSHSYQRCGARLPSRYKLMATLSDKLPTRCSVTQGCPMSKILFAWNFNPLIYLCHGGRLVGKFGEHPGEHILSGNIHISFEIDEYSIPFKKCHLVVDEIKVKSLGRGP